MFDSEFYPTPQSVIDIMLDNIKIEGQTILEPSAGSGAILKEIQKRNPLNVLACEKNEDLQIITKKYSQFLKEDFFEVTAIEVSHVNVIIMNPPFSNADAHIQHAWEIAPSGCSIVALCNYETLDNPYSRPRRRLKRVIDENGTYENLGNAFAKADRTTGIEIGLIRLFKPIDKNSTEYSGFYMDEEPEEENENGLMPFNEVRNVVQRYIGSIEAFKELEKANEVVNSYIKPIGLSDGLKYSVTYGKTVTDVESFSKELQKRSWEFIINKTGVKKFVTSGVLEDINKFVEQQTQYPFTMKNIYRMLEIIVKTRSQTMDRAMVEVFDKITKHHHKNRYEVEGWKTNSHYLVGQKFILENVVDYDSRWDGSKMKFHYNSYGVNKMNDFHKALCFLTGINDKTEPLYQMQQVVKSYGAKQKEYLTHNTWYNWGFFQIKGFKKGTLHVKFKDREVWARFNQKVAEIKGYPLPESI